MLLTGGVGPVVLQSEILSARGGVLFRMLLRVSFGDRLVSNGLRVVDKTSTESLILAQDERWRRA